MAAGRPWHAPAHAIKVDKLVHASGQQAEEELEAPRRDRRGADRKYGPVADGGGVRVTHRLPHRVQGFVQKVVEVVVGEAAAVGTARDAQRPVDGVVKVVVQQRVRRSRDHLESSREGCVAGRAAEDIELRLARMGRAAAAAAAAAAATATAAAAAGATNGAAAVLL